MDAWRKAYREDRLGDIAGFVPAVIVPEKPEKVTGLGCHRIEIVSVNGRILNRAQIGLLAAASDVVLHVAAVDLPCFGQPLPLVCRVDV